MYKPLPLDWQNWNPAQMTHADYAKIVKPDPPLTQEEKNNDALVALYEYSGWKEEIPAHILQLAESTKPEECKKAARLEARARTIKSHELRRMVLTEAGNLLAGAVGCGGPDL